MCIKVLKKLMALTLMLLLCISSLPALALTYSPGPRDYELDRSLVLEANKASLEENNVVFAAGGTIKFDVLLPFDSDKLQLEYNAPVKDVNLMVVTDEFTYEAKLEKKTTQIEIPITEVSASRTVTFKADQPLVLTGINFHKVDEQYNEQNIYLGPFTEYDEAMLTLIALKSDIGVIKTNNSLLRWNAEDIYVAPKNIDGSIYVPAKKLAEAMQLYCEDYQDLSYLYMLGEFSSLSLKDGKGFFEDNKKGKIDLELDVCYEDGKAWVPVRKVAELFGNTVGYKDGYVLIGDRLRIKKVFESEDFMKSLKSEFGSYQVPDKKQTGNTYHVAQTENASDANSGTEKYPFKTITRAGEVAKAGDTVIVHEGTYRETVKVKNNGTAMAPITFKAADGEKVVISALEKLSGFVEYKGDILCAPVDIDLGVGRNQLFYKGEYLIEGRHPNGDTIDYLPDWPENVPKGLYGTRGNIRITDKPNGEIAYSDTDLDQPDNFWKGAYYVSLKGQGWTMVSGEVVSSTKGKLVLTDHEGTKGNNLGILPNDSSTAERYYFNDAHDSDWSYLTNHINTVDIPGEWYMKDNVMYMIPPANADINNDFEVKQRQLVLDLRGNKFITFEGIDTIGGGMTLHGDETEGCTFLDGEFKYIAHHTKLLDPGANILYPDETRTSGNSMKSGEQGIYFGGKYNAMVNCVIDVSSAMGVALVGKYQYLTNNVISNCSYAGGTRGNVAITGHVDDQKKDASIVYGGHFVTYNTMYNAGRAVFHQGTKRGTGENAGSYGMTPSEVAYNRFFNGSLNTRDTGVVYEYNNNGGTDVSRTGVHNNYVYDIGHADKETKGMIRGIYHDGYTTSRDTYSNVVYYRNSELPFAEDIHVFSYLYSVVRCRNNSQLGHLPSGEEMLQKTDYPGGRMFGVGAEHGDYAQRFMANYEAHIGGLVSSYAVGESKIDKENNTETFKFENVGIEGNSATVLTYYLGRETKAPATFSIKAKVYDKSGSLIDTFENTTTGQSNRFYVEDVHKGTVLLTSLEKGKYDIELEVNDTYSDIYFVIPQTVDVKYDRLYSKEDEAKGVVSYNPVSSEVDEETGKETFTCKDVEFGEGRTLLKFHGTRQNSTASTINVTAYVYDDKGEVVTKNTFSNSFTNKKPQEYEVLEGSVVVDKVEPGTYDVVLEFDDEYFNMVRLLPEEASPSYENLFKEHEVILGGSYDRWDKGEAYEADATSKTNYALERIETFNYWSSNNTWDHTFYYDNRTISESAKMLRVVNSTGGKYAGSIVKMYVDSLDSTPIAVWNPVDNSTWSYINGVQYVKLNRTLKPGTYNFIVKFEGPNLCSTLYSMAFCNEKWSKELDK